MKGDTDSHLEICKRSPRDQTRRENAQNICAMEFEVKIGDVFSD